MTPALRTLTGLWLAPWLGGCSFGLFQTAHTQPPRTATLTVGGTYLSNELDDEESRTPITRLGAEVGARVGVIPRVEVGLGTFFQSGGRVNAKVNVLDPTGPFALSPRVGVGYQWKYGVWMAEGGAIASYRFFDVLEPYFGLTFANHWIGKYPPPDTVPRNVAPGTGTGDGLLQAALGLEFMASNRVGLIAEYGHWFVLTDDPGDFYAFLPTNIVGFALRFGAVRIP